MAHKRKNTNSKNIKTQTLAPTRTTTSNFINTKSKPYITTNKPIYQHLQKTVTYICKKRNTQTKNTQNISLNTSPIKHRACQHLNPLTQTKDTQYFSNISTNKLRASQYKNSDHIAHTNQRTINLRYLSKSTIRYQPQLFSSLTHKYDVYFKHKVARSTGATPRQLNNNFNRNLTVSLKLSKLQPLTKGISCINMMTRQGKGAARILTEDCHQKYFTLQFRPSPSEIVVMTRRSSPLTIQCIIPNSRWNIHKLTSSILCHFNFLMLGCYLIFICLQRPPGRFGYTSPQ